ncbi:MAG: hypothetical protein WCX08_03965 [Candidatus Buchananbacteria bacterium]|jgi:hypothetical protein
MNQARREKLRAEVIPIIAEFTGIPEAEINETTRFQLSPCIWLQLLNQIVLKTGVAIFLDKPEEQTLENILRSMDDR